MRTGSTVLALALCSLAAGACGGGSGSQPLIDAAHTPDGNLGPDAAANPPRAGDVGATCMGDMDCTNVPSGQGTCAAFGAMGLGCMDACQDHADCGEGNYCNDFEMAGFPLGKQCVHGCTTNADCNADTTCVCDMGGGLTETWCSPWSPEC